ncbi:MAG: 4-amino-4-deoxy-L-arabinose transferase [Moorea sp. SIO2B7]|nr:4-amino-4-deoxy-L-arabinose transferase [Moorena sp. SIO2B7]
MFVCLPIISLIILSLIFHTPDKDWRSAALSAAVVWGVLLTGFTEILSLFRFLTFGSVLTLWGLTIIVLGLIYYRLIKQGKRSLNIPNISNITPVSLVLLGGIVFIIATVGLIAIVAPPNTWDSMTYHMTRVVHWIQNQSVAHYPTYFSAQLVHPPFAEFAIMHFQILSGGDRFANLVQWLSMVGSIIGVSIIAKQLGADGRGQIFAAVFCATIPMGILQASSTQNDYAVCFWLVCLAHYVLLVLPSKNPPIPLVLGIGASMGLAVLTKSTAYFYAFPFMVWLFIVNVKRMRWKLWRPISIVTVIFLSLNLNHYLRNLDLYGHPLATAEYSEHYRIEVYSLSTWISNVIRNLSLHVDIVRHLGLQGFITPITGIVAKLITIIHSFLGLDMNDPRTTFPVGSYKVPGLSFDENVAGNPLHLFLIFLALAFFLFYKKLRIEKQTVGYLLTLIGGFFLLCLMLKIQIFHSRHHLSLFVLFSAFVGLVFSKNWNRHLVTFMAIILIVTSMQWVFGGKARPILAEQNIFNSSRNELYFQNRRHLKQPYLEAANFLKTQECANIGLSLGWKPVPSGIYWEYPFWTLIKTNNDQVVRFEHILHPDNMTAKKSDVYPHNNFTPCAIIAVRSSKDEKIDKMVTKTGTYLLKWSADPISILMK